MSIYHIITLSVYNCLVDPRILPIHLMIRWLWCVVIWNNLRRQMSVHIIYCYVQKNWNVALRLMATYMYHFNLVRAFVEYALLYIKIRLFLNDHSSLFKRCLISYTSLAELQWFLSVNLQYISTYAFGTVIKNVHNFRGFFVLSHHLHCCFYEIWDIWWHSRVVGLQCLFLACLSKCFHI